MDKKDANRNINMTGRGSSAKALSDQALLKMKAVSQLRQSVRTSPNRTALAYNLGKDFIIALQYLPVIVLNKVQPLLDSYNPVFNNYSEKAQADQKIISAISPSHLLYTSSNPRESPPPTSPAVVSSATSILNSITASFNYSTNGSIPPTPPPDSPQAQLDKIFPVPSITSIHRNQEAENIEIRTKYLTSLVKKNVGVATPHNLVHHLEALFMHLQQHQVTVPVAIKNGLLTSLVKVLKLYPDDVYVLYCTRELLAILGYNPPVKGRGINILSIDGGGVRGLVAIELLRQIEKVTKKRVHELFDYICGVSTGSILAFLLGAHHRTLDECEALYKQLGREVFNQNSIVGTGSLMWSHAYYHTPTFEKILKKHIGETSLLSLARDPNSPRVAAISTVVNHERIAPYVFRTYSFPSGIRTRYAGGFQHDMWEAVRASSAAPTYFEEIRLGNYLHQDGGILVNNPCSVALSEAKTIWSGVPLHCVVSLGTGLTFSACTDPHLLTSVSTPETKVVTLSWKKKFLKVLDSATDTEAIHYTLNELLSRDIYFRFNPYLTEVVSLDEGNQEKLAVVQAETRDYMERNHARVEYVGKVLLKKKRIDKKVTEWWKH